MALTLPTVDAVRAIITTELTDEQVQSYIDDAAVLVTRCVTPLTAAEQAVIIKYVAAHLILSNGFGSSEAATNVAMTSMKLGDASETYSRATTGSGLAGTAYGQQAIALDPNGCLAHLGQRQIIFKVL